MAARKTTRRSGASGRPLPRPLPAKALRWRCDPKLLDFATTEELQEPTEMVGQPRAVEALRFGVGIKSPGFNLYALGPSGSGKRSLVQRVFRERAAGEPAAADWCYVHNFDVDNEPRALRLPSGRAAAFRRDLEGLIEDARAALVSAFESDEYQARREELETELQARQQEAFEAVQKMAIERDLALLRTPAGMVFIPARGGEPLSPQELERLTAEQKEEIQAKVQVLQEELQRRLRQLPRWQKEKREKQRQLDRDFAEIAIGGLIEELISRYEELPEVVTHLQAVRDDIMEQTPRFVQGASDAGADPATALAALAGQAASPLRRYGVNVLVDHAGDSGAPVVFEDNPTFENLLGRVEYVARLGAMTTDHLLIRPGALHRANGGYLVLEARKVLSQPFVWEGLKRALRARRIRIGEPSELRALIRSQSLEPEAIPLDVKVALIGDPLLYSLLSAVDPEFDELFKVAADFAEAMPRDDEALAVYARLLAGLAKRHGLRPFERSAVARLLEESARLAGNSERLSTRFRGLEDLMREADYRAGEAGKKRVNAKLVEDAIRAQEYRSDRIRERIQEEIERGTLRIDCSGEQVGQVNGLAVLQIGRFAFGKPSRISARVRLGDGKVIDIEREVELGGPLHTKGVLILAGFLGARFGRRLPLSLAASLVFEQSYGGVDGDSASSAELYALLSAIANVPIRQRFAVTGSVDQHGRVQAIGGVNEKVEGFFDVCAARGLTGDQGVLVPAANVQHLMLRPDVVAAARARQFHVHAVETIDQGIEILTGMPAGEADSEGKFPEGTFNHAVERELRALHERQVELARAARKEPET